MTTRKRIPIAECAHAGFYRVADRNLTFGVCVEGWWFIGPREKHDDIYLANEIHHECGGCLSPQELLEMCPVTPLDVDNDALFAWINQAIERYYAPIDAEGQRLSALAQRLCWSGCLATYNARHRFLTVVGPTGQQHQVCPAHFNPVEQEIGRLVRTYCEILCHGDSSTPCP